MCNKLCEKSPYQTCDDISDQSAIYCRADDCDFNSRQTCRIKGKNCCTLKLVTISHDGKCENFQINGEMKV